MIRREFFEQVIALVEGKEADISNIKSFAETELIKIETNNQRRREKMAEKRAENIPLINKIYSDILGEEPTTASTVGEILEISPQKASVLLRKMVEEGHAAALPVKVSKRGIQKGYIKL